MEMKIPLNSKCNKIIKVENLDEYLYTFPMGKDFLRQREKEKNNDGIRRHHKVGRGLKQSIFAEYLYFYRLGDKHKVSVSFKEHLQGLQGSLAGLSQLST